MGFYSNRTMHRFAKALNIFKSFFLPPQKFYKTCLYFLNGYRLQKDILGLHLGSGGDRIKGFLNIDANPFCECDIIGGADRLKFRSDSVGTIYNSHIFEHFSHRKIQRVMGEWFRVLKPGGTLYISVPDLEVLSKIYLENIPLYDQGEKDAVDLAAGIIYGGQTTRYDFHHYGYSFITLKWLLEKTGFKKVERFDREELEFAPFDDAARSAKIKTTSISLNVKATK